MNPNIYRFGVFWVAEVEAESLKVTHFFYTKAAAEFGAKLAAQELQRRLGAIREAQGRVAGERVGA